MLYKQIGHPYIDLLHIIFHGFQNIIRDQVTPPRRCRYTDLFLKPHHLRRRRHVIVIVVVRTATSTTGFRSGGTQGGWRARCWGGGGGGFPRRRKANSRSPERTKCRQGSHNTNNFHEATLEVRSVLVLLANQNDTDDDNNNMLCVNCKSFFFCRSDLFVLGLASFLGMNDVIDINMNYSFLLCAWASSIRRVGPNPKNVTFVRHPFRVLRGSVCALISSVR